MSSVLRWIKVYADLPTHPKSRKLAKLTGNRMAWAHVVQLWLWASQNAPDGQLADTADEDIAIAAGVLSGGLKFVQALRDCGASPGDPGFLDRNGALHDWDDEQRAHVERLAADAERKRRSRAASAGRPADSPQESPQESPPGHADSPQDLPLRASARGDLRSEKKDKRSRHTHVTPADPGPDAPDELPVCLSSPLAPEEQEPRAPPGAPAAPAPERAPTLVVHEGGKGLAMAERAFALFRELLGPPEIRATPERLHVLQEACLRRGEETITRHIEGLAGNPKVDRTKFPVWAGLWSDDYIDRGLAWRQDKLWRNPRRKAVAPPAPPPEPVPEGPRRPLPELLGEVWKRPWESASPAPAAPPVREAHADLARLDPDAIEQRRRVLREQAARLVEQSTERDALQAVR